MSSLPTKPHMSDNEIAVFEKYLNQSSNYLEYGSGGSTVLAHSKNIKKITSIESDQKWVDMLKNELSGVDFYVIDIGKTGDWGRPLDDKCKDKYPNYSHAISNLKEIPDLILVDGRFRVACCLETLLRVDPKSKIVIHDFWNREAYHVVLPFLNVIDKVDTLGVFTKKEDVDETQIKQLLEKYKYNSN
jgi:protein O-GlcNAc transferase